MEKKEFQQALLQWYAANKRDLPWRKTTDAYKILVSEIMLQQTQVSRVIPKYEVFLERFPTAHVLARAPPADVITLWAGLGYNRRAVNLQKAAKAVCVHGSFPTTSLGLQELPGIGPYTAAAVASFSYNDRVAVVDTNVIRVLSRLFFGVETAGKEKVSRLAQQLVPEDARTWNNAVMEFGALICAATPQCPSCPFSSDCPALKNGFPEGVPKIKQSPFEGSSRQARGKILAILRGKKVETAQALSQEIKLSLLKTKKLLAGLEKDGLVVIENKGVRLP